jgi:hypothetical protein
LTRLGYRLIEKKEKNQSIPKPDYYSLSSGFAFSPSNIRNLENTNNGLKGKGKAFATAR